MKKVFLGITGIATLAAPVVTLSCGDTKEKPIFHGWNSIEGDDYKTKVSSLTDRLSYLVAPKTHEDLAHDYLLLDPEVKSHSRLTNNDITFDKYIIKNKERVSDIYVETFDPKKTNFDLLHSYEGLNDYKKISEIYTFNQILKSATHYDAIVNGDFFNMNGAHRAKGLLMQDGIIYNNESLSRYVYSENYATIYKTKTGEVKIMENSPLSSSEDPKNDSFSFKIKIGSKKYNSRLLYNNALLDNHQALATKKSFLFIGEVNPIKAVRDQEVVASIVNVDLVSQKLDWTTTNAYEIQGINNGKSVVANKISAANFDAKFVRKLKAEEQPKLGNVVLVSKTPITIGSEKISGFYETTSAFPKELKEAVWALGALNQIPVFHNLTEPANYIIKKGVELEPTVSVDSIKKSGQENASVPREMFAINKDKTVSIYQFQKNNFASKGFSTLQMQDFMKMNNVQEAISFDGGGSTCSAMNLNDQWYDFARTIDFGERSMPIFFGIGGNHEK